MATKQHLLVVAMCLSVGFSINDSGVGVQDISDAALEEAALEEAALKDEAPVAQPTVPERGSPFKDGIPLASQIAPEVQHRGVETSQDAIHPAPGVPSRLRATRVQPQATTAPLPAATVSVKEHLPHLSLSADSTPTVANGVAGRPLKETMTSAELEAAVSDLYRIGSLGLTKEEFEATPFGDSVKKIEDLITKDMMPKVMTAHDLDQKELDSLAKLVAQCSKVKAAQFQDAKPANDVYQKMGPLHTTCRQGEAGLFAEKKSCWEDEADKRKVKDLKCQAYATVSAKYSNQNANRAIVSKSGSEAAETYVRRLSGTFCGGKGGGGKGGFGKGGFLDEFLVAKEACEKATRDWAMQKMKCEKLNRQLATKRLACDGVQDLMDQNSCKYAVDIKDSCETYAECYLSRKANYDLAENTTKTDEVDRQAEWKGLKKMECIVRAFKDGKVTNAEITACKNGKHSVKHLIIKYPTVPAMETCEVPKEYPYTAEYKKKQFAPLPAVAKGRDDANECTGVATISTQPAKGSPNTCKCDRLTMNGAFGPGPLVKCVNCLDIRRSNDKSSCPDGTKLFSPRSRDDWKTFFASENNPLRAPHFVIDVTRPQNGCGGCTGSPMNSASAAQKSWQTTDGSPWWLRSTSFNEPNGDYHANCFIDVHANHKTPLDKITFNDKNCRYHSKSYYCQLQDISTTPKKGSPNGCMCERITLSGSFSPKALLRCKGCLDVYRSKQKNSCPDGTKLFSPRSREDWKTFIASAGPVRSPHWIIDVTRPQNGCGGCTRKPMNSDTTEQKTWRTSDGSAWWLRSITYNEPNGDYTGNCYLDLWQTPMNENSVTWNDGSCNYHSNSYYCQPARRR